jgi:hypothetical protein
LCSTNPKAAEKEYGVDAINNCKDDNLPH